MSDWILKKQLQARNAVNDFVKGEEAPTAVEYGIMVALIAVVVIAAVIVIGTELDQTFDTVGSKLKTANT